MANVAKGQDKSVALRVSRFFRESRAELRKVTWPNRQELVTYTRLSLSPQRSSPFFSASSTSRFAAFGLAR